MQTTPDSPVAEPPAGFAACAQHPDQATGVVCNECKSPICPECQVRLQENVYCQACVERSKASLRVAVAEMTSNPNYLGAFILGLIAACACAYAWGMLTHQTGARWGLAAIGVGIAVGWSVTKGAGNKRGLRLQVLSLVLTVLGILGGLFFETHFLLGQLLAEKHAETQLTLGLTMKIFPSVIAAETGVMTWVIVAIGAWQGWSGPKAPSLDL